MAYKSPERWWRAYQKTVKEREEHQALVAAERELRKAKREQEGIQLTAEQSSAILAELEYQENQIQELRAKVIRLERMHGK